MFSAVYMEARGAKHKKVKLEKNRVGRVPPLLKLQQLQWNYLFCTLLEKQLSCP